ncbi:rhodanese-like domain-containing protein, partial [Diaphorobacter sp.]
MPTQQPLVVDVRSPAEFANGHVAGAINLPLSELAERVTSVLPQRDAPLVLCCVSGARSDVAAQW